MIRRWCYILEGRSWSLRQTTIDSLRSRLASAIQRRFSEGLESVSLSPHGTSSRGIKRLWGLDFSQDILALLASLALELKPIKRTRGVGFPPHEHPSTAADALDALDALPVASIATHPITSGSPPKASATLPPPIAVVAAMSLTPVCTLLDPCNAPAAGQRAS